LETLWKKQIFSEIQKNKDQLALLSPSERATIEELVSSDLELISDNGVKALNTLFSKLEVIDLKLDDFFDFMTRTSDVITVEELNANFERFKASKIGSIDIDRIRLRLVKEGKHD
jgi:hypothetical protein